METSIKQMKCVELKKDPNVNIIRKYKDLIKNGKLSTKMKNKLKVNKTAVSPMLVGLLKDYKQNSFPPSPRAHFVEMLSSHLWN